MLADMDSAITTDSANIKFDKNAPDFTFKLSQKQEKELQKKLKKVKHHHKKGHKKSHKKHHKKRSHTVKTEKPIAVAPVVPKIPE